MLQHLEEALKRVVYGQDKAIEALSASTCFLPAPACASRKKPIGCYLFSGPTGVGKTEVAKQLAAVLGVEPHPFRYVGIYGAPHRVAAERGAPPGYAWFSIRAPLHRRR